MTTAPPKPSSKPPKAGAKPKAAATMRAALEDARLLGGVLSGDSWRAWRVLLIAILGEPLDDSERAIFTALTGRDKEPLAIVDEFWGIVGRRGGKSRAMATLAVFLAVFRNYDSVTVIGEKPTVLVMAQNVKQAGVILGYIGGIFDSTPMLAGMVKSRTQDAIEISNNVTIEVRPANFRGPERHYCGSLYMR
jgi:hypothetical protein